MQNDNSKLDLLREEILNGQLSRRSVLKRAMVMGLSAPVIAGLLAACGDDDDEGGDDAPDATNTTGSGSQATTPAGGATAPADGATATAGDEEDDASPTAGSGTGTTEEMTGHGRGVADLLRILYWQAPTILNAHFSQGTKDSAAASLVLEPLIDVAADGSLIPVLAAEIPSLENGGVAEDGMSVTYKLKEGVVWSDGEPFTAEDVVFTWEYTTDEAATTTSIATYEPVESVEVVDDLTVTDQLQGSEPRLVRRLRDRLRWQILPKHILEDFMGAAARDAAFNLNPIGTGPYKVAEFRPGDVVLYEINENYREADKPYFKTVEFKGGGDATSAARAALESGETDWAWNLQVEKAVLEPMAEGRTSVRSSSRQRQRRADPRQLCRPEHRGRRRPFRTNHAAPVPSVPRSAPGVRHRLRPRHDRRATVRPGREGDIQPAGCSGELRLAEHDLRVRHRSRSCDARGRWLDGSPREKDGVEMSVIYQTTINPLRQKTQEIIKPGWEEMGVAIELKSIDAGVYFSSDAGNPDTACHFYADFEMFTNGPSSPYPIAYMAGWKSIDPAVDLSQKSNAWSGTNTTRWVNEEFNDLYTQALTELDPDTQVELFVAMNDLVVNEVVGDPARPPRRCRRAANRLKGYIPSPWTTDVRDIANWYFEE